MCLNIQRSRTAPVDGGFERRMIDVINDAALAQMIPVGHRTGLLDTLARLEPSTSTQIAIAAGLDEPYVREWLGAMVTGRVVEHDAPGGTFWLAEEKARCLTRAAAPSNWP